MVEINITEMERDVLVNGLYRSNFNDVTIADIEEHGKYGDCFNGMFIVVWSDCVIDSCKITKENQLSGVVSSLVQKGLVACYGDKREATVTLTEEGFEVLKTLV
jgi:hypothetical protein